MILKRKLKGHKFLTVDQVMVLNLCTCSSDDAYICIKFRENISKGDRDIELMPFPFCYLHIIS